MNNMNQFIFDLETKINFSESDFFVNSTNKKAVDLVSLWPDWHNKAAIIYGESKSGKSHLGNIWMQRADATLIDLKNNDINNNKDSKINYLIDNFSLIKSDQENVILDVFNQCLFNNNYILFLCSEIKDINFKLKDLESRFNSIFSTIIEKPDDQIIEVLIIKYFSDHQVLITNDVIKYLSGRIERSYNDLFNMLNKINNLSLKNKQKITIPFLRENFFK
jgi:chromosomal replication initiation ATPase DnaA